MTAYANFDSKKHLTRLHLFPSESCQHDDSKGVKPIRTRKQMLAALLSVTKLDQLCAHEYEGDA